MQFAIPFLFSVIAVFVVKNLIALRVELIKVIAGLVSVVLIFISFNSPVRSIIFLIYSMLLSPEIGVGEVPGRSVVVRYDDIFLIIIFITWLVKNALSKGRPFIIKTPILIPLFSYTTIYIISTILGIMRGDISWKKSVFYVLKYTEYFILYFMSLNILSEEKSLERFFKHGFIVLLIVVAYSFYYYLNATGDFIRTTAPFEAPLNKPQESEPASLGGYYFLAVFLILGYLSETSDIKRIVLMILVLMAIYLSFLLTFSRASYYGMIVGVLAFLFVLKKRKFVFMYLIVFFVLFSIFLPGISDKVKARIKSTYEGEYATNIVMTPFGMVRLEDSAYARYKSLENVILNVIPHYPLLGKGVTGIGLGDNQYALLLGESGILGFLAFWWLIFSVMIMAIKVYRFSDDILGRVLGIGIFCATWAFLGQGIGVNTFIIIRIMEPYWFCVAVLTIAYMRMVKNNVS